MGGIVLKSERIHIRSILYSDLEAIHNLHSLSETDRFNTLGIPENIEQTAAIINLWLSENNKEKIQKFTFAVELIEGKKFIGLIALNLGKEKFQTAEVWYKFHPAFWNKGYATEALKKIIDFGFKELKLYRIEAGCAIENIASIKVLEKVGMIREGQKRKVLPLKTGWSDNFEYAILSTD
ncbi:MAG TPA: GNAT family N-acetyltransferase [Daejeonella sp.]|uniref:GNAT family N-acetyltransferase n=1 Tax=Daejeonella sp. TaxID=2805397 RepID=UPI002EDA0A05